MTGSHCGVFSWGETESRLSKLQSPHSVSYFMLTFMRVHIHGGAGHLWSIPSMVYRRKNPGLYSPKSCCLLKKNLSHTSCPLVFTVSKLIYKIPQISLVRDNKRHIKWGRQKWTMEEDFPAESWVGWFREHSAFNHMIGKIFSLSLKPNPLQAVTDCSFPYLIFLFQGYHFPNVLKRIDLKVVKANFVVPVIHVRKIFSQKKQVHENIFTTINCWFHISLKRGGKKNLWIISDVL